MWWQDKATEHTYDWLQASLQRQVKCLSHCCLMSCDIALCLLLTVKLSSTLYDTKASVIFVRVICWLLVSLCKMWFRHNEGAWKWCLILSIKVNEVSMQLTQSRPWLYNDSFTLFDNNTGHSLCSRCQIMHLVYLLDFFKSHGVNVLLLHHASINFDVNNSLQDPYRLINVIKKKNSLQKLSFH